MNYDELNKRIESSIKKLKEQYDTSTVVDTKIKDALVKLKALDKKPEIIEGEFTSCNLSSINELRTILEITKEVLVPIAVSQQIGALEGVKRMVLEAGHVELQPTEVVAEQREVLGQEKPPCRAIQTPSGGCVCKCREK